MGPTRYLSATRGTYNIICAAHDLHIPVHPDRPIHPFPCPVCYCIVAFSPCWTVLIVVLFPFIYTCEALQHPLPIADQTLLYGLCLKVTKARAKVQSAIGSINLYEFIKLSGTINLMTGVSHPLTTAKVSELTICNFLFFFTDSIYLLPRWVPTSYLQKHVIPRSTC